MKKAKQLMEECVSRNYHCSITWQRMTDYSVEIYRGYVTNYKEIFYTDSNVSAKKAIKKALKFLSKN